MPRGLGLVRFWEGAPHLPFRDTYVDYTRFPRVDEKLLYEDATKAYEDAVRGVTEAEERDMWHYLNSIRDDVVYCGNLHAIFMIFCSMAWRCRFLPAPPGHWLISTQVVYGRGSPFSSQKFGRAPRRTSWTASCCGGCTEGPCLRHCDPRTAVLEATRASVAIVS